MEPLKQQLNDMSKSVHLGANAAFKDLKEKYKNA